MTQKLTLTIVLITVTFASLILLPNRTNGQAVNDTQFIQAEVNGILHFQEGRGYFISVKSNEFPKQENQVWLWISENKKLIRQLQGLLNRAVTAKGELEQLPENVTASVPPHGMYVHSFQIEEAKNKTNNKY